MEETIITNNEKIIESPFSENKENIKAKDEGMVNKINNPKEQESFFGKAINFATFGMVGANVFDASDKNEKKDISTKTNPIEISPLKEDNIKIEEVKKVEDKPYTSLYDVLEKNYFEKEIVKVGPKIEDINTPIKDTTKTIQENKVFVDKINSETKIEDKIKVVKDNKDILEKQDVKFDDRASKLVGKVKLEGKPELQVELNSNVNKVIKDLNKVEDKVVKDTEAQQKWLQKNITTSDVASIVNKFEPTNPAERKLVESMFDPHTQGLIKILNDVNENKKALEDIVAKEAASRGTFNVFATDKEKEAKDSIEKLNQELKDLSGKFNDRILPVMKELGHDIKGIEQAKAQEKINLEKVEQEKIQRDLEEKMQNLGR